MNSHKRKQREGYAVKETDELYGIAVKYIAYLASYYEKELGAELIDPNRRRMVIDEQAARRLFERYYGESKQ